VHHLLLKTGKPKLTLSVLTIGHSNHPIERFLGLLREHGVEVPVDARSQPYSRFSTPVLAQGARAGCAA